MEQNLNLYQVFYEVANCRNFSSAARKLYISQPAISKAIAKLEENLDTALFLRSSRGVSLTIEGELLYRHVEQALNTLKSGEEQLRIASRKVTHLSIGVSTMLCKYVLLPVLKDFLNENPDIKITISCQSTLDTLALLQAGSIDVGLVGLPSQWKSESEKSHAVSYTPLKTIEDIFVATDSYLSSFATRHKGKSHEKKDYPEDRLKNEAAFILLNRENISRKHVDAFLDGHQLAFQNIIEVNNMDLSIEFARAGLGIACVIRDFVEKDLKNGTLRQVRLGHQIPERQIGFATMKKASGLRAAEALIDYCRYRQGEETSISNS